MPLGPQSSPIYRRLSVDIDVMLREITARTPSFVITRRCPELNIVLDEGNMPPLFSDQFRCEPFRYHDPRTAHEKNTTPLHSAATTDPLLTIQMSPSAPPMKQDGALSSPPHVARFPL